MTYNSDTVRTATNNTPTQSAPAPAAPSVTPPGHNAADVTTNKPAVTAKSNSSWPRFGGAFFVGNSGYANTLVGILARTRAAAV